MLKVAPILGAKLLDGRRFGVAAIRANRPTRAWAQFAQHLEAKREVLRHPGNVRVAEELISKEVQEDDRLSRVGVKAKVRRTADGR